MKTNRQREEIREEIREGDRKQTIEDISKGQFRIRDDCNSSRNIVKHAEWKLMLFPSFKDQKEEDLKEPFYESNKSIDISNMCCRTINTHRKCMCGAFVSSVLVLIPSNIHCMRWNITPTLMSVPFTSHLQDQYLQLIPPGDSTVQAQCQPGL